jgi:hypothetical protein
LDIKNCDSIASLWQKTTFPQLFELGEIRLSIQETNLSAVLFGTNGKVNPMAIILILFDKELIEIFFRFVRIIHKDGGIAYRLLYAVASDIHSATGQMV